MTERYTKVVPWKYGSFLGLIHDPDQFGLIQATGEYCESEVDVFRHFVKEDSVVLDCGASMGAHTVALAKLCPKGRVYACEPQRIPFQVMCGNVQLNSCCNVEALPVAVGTGSGPVRMAELSPYRDEKWGMNQITEDGTYFVSQVPIDVLLSENSFKIDFIKIDVEGYEPYVLKGAAETIRRSRPAIYLEYNWNQEEIRAILEGHGYSMWTHEAPAAREPNFNGVGIPNWPGTPMLLALPAEPGITDDTWVLAKGFTHVI